MSFAEREQIMQYGLWQDYGTGRETPLGNSGADGSPESITLQSCD